jgi:hypothetical protein
LPIPRHISPSERPKCVTFKCIMMIVTICKLAIAAALLVTHPAKATQPPPIGTTLFDEVILQHGHLMLGHLQVVNFMSYEQIEVALSMLFFHKYLNPKQASSLNEIVFQKALLDNLYKLWQKSESLKPSALSEFAFESCHLMQYLRMPLLKRDGSFFKDDLKKYQRVHVSEAIERVNPELHNPDDGKLFANSLIEFLPAMTVGYGLLVGDSNYWKKAKDAKMARIFMFAFLNLNVTGLEEYMIADNALDFLRHAEMSSNDMVNVWPKLFDASQYKGLGKIALSKEEAELGGQGRKRIIQMKRRKQPYKKLTGNDDSHGFQLTTVPFRSISLICKQPLMLKKAAMTEGPVYKNMSCLLQANDPVSRGEDFRENVLADLKEIAKLESLIASEGFTVSSLFIRHTKEFLIDRSFVLSQDFHALPLRVQNMLLTETRPDGMQPDEDTPTSIIASLQPCLDFFRNACRQDFTATELESANKLNWLVLDIVCPGSKNKHVLLQYSEHTEPLHSKNETKNTTPKHQYYQALWGANKQSPNNYQYVGIAHIDAVDTRLYVELLIVPAIDTTDASQRKAVLKVKSYSGLNMAVIWWDPKSKLVRLQKLFLDNTVCQVTIPQHLILDDCPQEYGLEHRMIVVLSTAYLPTLEEAAQMLTMKDRQLHDLKDPKYYEYWTIVTVKPKRLANLEYVPNFPLSRPNRFLAIANEYSDIQKLDPMCRSGDAFKPFSFLMLIGKKLLHSVLTTSQSNAEMSKAAWLVALEDLGPDQNALLNEQVEHDSTTTIMSCLSEHSWTCNQLVTGNYIVASLPAVVRFLWHQHRLMIAVMLGCTQDALNWDTSLASDLMTLSVSDCRRGITSDVLPGLISFFKQGFWDAASPPKRHEWLQTMQYVHPHISSYFHSSEFMPVVVSDSDSLPTVHENVTPAVSDGVLAHRRFIIRVASIVGSEQAKAKGFVDFVPVLVSRHQFMISSNQSGLHYAILDRNSPYNWSIYEPDNTTRHKVNNVQILTAHHCRDTLEKLLLNYASYEQRSILPFVLLDEHFLVYDFL